MEKYGRDERITYDLLQQMKAKAQLMQEELDAAGADALATTGNLTGVRLNEQCNEYENYVLTIQHLEQLLAESDECK